MVKKKILSNFINTVCLMQHNGIDMNIWSPILKIKGTLLIVTADTLVSKFLGKFKEGVTFALKNFRMCEIENSNLKNIYDERPVVLRNKVSHHERCDDLECMWKQAKIYWNKPWGIKLWAFTNWWIWHHITSWPRSDAFAIERCRLEWAFINSFSIHLCSIILFIEVVEYSHIIIQLQLLTLQL